MKATVRLLRASTRSRPALMNPNSNYYLAINTGFPNAYDRANDRHGGFLDDSRRLLVARLLCHDRRADR